MDKPKYLFHGSSKRFESLEPNQTSDFLNDAATQYGVFATSNRDVALAFALGAIPDERGRVTRVMQSIYPVQMVFLEGHPNLGGKGYLYTVLSEGFELIDPLQWVCHQSVVPVEITEINVDDCLHLFRYATDEERSEMLRETEPKNERNET